MLFSDVQERFEGIFLHISLAHILTHINLSSPKAFDIWNHVFTILACAKYSDVFRQDNYVKIRS